MRRDPSLSCLILASGHRLWHLFVLPQLTFFELELTLYSFVPAMAPLFACAEILSAIPHTPPPSNQENIKKTPCLQSATSIQEVLETLCTSSDIQNEEEEPAQKRRRLDNGNVIASEQKHFDESKSIVLTKMLLDLVFIHCHYQKRVRLTCI